MTADYNKERWGELNLKYLILDSDDYIVFIDDEGDPDWITSSDYDKKGPATPEKHHDILNMVALLECKPIAHLSENDRLNFKRWCLLGVLT